MGAGDGGDKHEVDVRHVAAAHRVYELLHRRHLVESQISVQQWNGQSHGGKIKINCKRDHGETTRKRKNYQNSTRKKKRVVFDASEIFGKIDKVYGVSFKNFAKRVWRMLRFF